VDPHSLLPPGRLKATPEDFVVDEAPLYEPSGDGDHLYVRFTKRDLTTDVAARAIAEALYAPQSAPMRDVGIAGMKDKRAITTQTISIPIPRGKDVKAADEIAAFARTLALPGITILDARRHGHKLKTGHLASNRFDIIVRAIPSDRAAEVIASLERMGREGVPNAFGTQRFGRDQDNASRALAWLTGKLPAPKDPRQRRFLWSSLQSQLFNEVLARRVADGTWAAPLVGDLLKKVDSGGIFPCLDVETDGERARRGELAPTGPMFGVKMRSPEGEPGKLEQDVFDEHLGREFDLARTKVLGEGTRRALRMPVYELRADRIDDGSGDASVQVRFVLPRGAYATTVLAAAIDDTGDRARASTASLTARSVDAGSASSASVPGESDGVGESDGLEE
jgi:tRNA pseudouridine13 synthase